MGKRERYGGHLAVCMGPLGETPTERRAQAVEMLGELVALYEEGLSNPIPLPCETAYGWQRNLGSGRGKAWGTAMSAWETDRFNPEAQDAAHELLLGGTLSFRELFDLGFEDYCARLWGPIISLSREKNL